MRASAGPADRWVHPRRILALVALAVCAYLPVLRLPFLEDDYVMIPMSSVYAAQNWIPLLHDVDFRTRPMQLFLNVAIDHVFGYTPRPYYAANILLHVLCVLLVYAAGVWVELGFSASFWAACFFAIYEGHQEAVMWASGSSELLVFLFGMAAWACWVRWLQGGGWRWHATAVVAFALALESKESAVVFPLLMLIPVLADRKNLRRALSDPRRERGVMGIAPFFALTALYVGWIWFSRVAQPGYSDIRFSLSSPWPIVIARSFWRMVFIWGLLAAAILFWSGRWGRERSARRMLWMSSLWMVLGILPYSFLTYMTQLPSRSTYLGSAGLALLVGAAAARLWSASEAKPISESRRRRVVVLILSAIVLVTNLEILWVKKMSQFRERSEPSELLKQVAAQAAGPVTIECTPLLPIIAEVVIEQAGGHIAAPQARQESHCFVIQYESRTGDLVRVDRRMAMQKHGLFY
jgi:hypothetical protein